MSGPSAASGTGPTTGTALPGEATGAASEPGGRGGRGLPGRQHLRGRTGLVIGLLVLGVPVLTTLVGVFVHPYPTTASVSAPLAGPSGAHPLGTDLLGRDVLSRMLVGGRSLLLITVLAVASAQLIAVSAGLLAGWLGRGGARAVLAVFDVVLAVPAVLVLAAAASALGVGGLAAFAAIVVVLTPPTARVIHAATRALVTEPYVEAAVLCGTPTRQILVRDLLPNLRTIIVADAGTRMVEAIIIISAAGFLGFGPQPPTPDWGQMINENGAGITVAPWCVLAPALAITLLAVGTNLISDWLVAHSDGTNRQ